MKECANCGNERIMLCPFCEHDFSKSSKDRDASIRELEAAVAERDEAVKVLAKGVMWAEYWQCPDDQECEMCDDFAAIEANPIARAAVDAAKEKA